MPEMRANGHQSGAGAIEPLIGIVVFHPALRGIANGHATNVLTAHPAVGIDVSRRLIRNNVIERPTVSPHAPHESNTIPEHILTRQAAFSAVGAFGRDAAIVAVRP